jgi:hypothetical protein
MKRIYFLLVWIFISSFSLFAQSPSITIADPWTACLNSVQKINVVINGEYHADNKFLVQIRKEENEQVVAEIPARLVDGKIEVVHSDSSFSLLRYIQIRIVTTSPRTESNWRNVTLGSKGIVDMALAAPDTVNAGEDLLLKFNSFSNSTVQVTLNDSSVFSLNARSGAFTTSYHRKGVNVTTPFYMAHARNECGAMKVSGQVRATINPTTIKVLSVSPAAACEGSEIEVSFGTSGPELPANTRYRLRIAVFDGDLVSPKTVEVPAQLKDNVLVATFPTAFNVNLRSAYKLRIEAVSKRQPQVFKLLNVFGQCGVGKVVTPSAVTVSFVTAEPGAVQASVIVAPNPASDYLQINFASARPRAVTLVDSRGISVWQGKFNKQDETLNIAKLVPGVYLLRIEESGKTRVYRVVKH